MKRKILLTIVVIVLLVLFMFPMQQFYVLWPEKAGLSCPQETLCIDDMERLKEAQDLAQIAWNDVIKKLGPIERAPKVIFCSSQTCYDKFGLNKPAAHSVGSIAVIVGPRGWKEYYLRHEFIHTWQYVKLGDYNVLFNLPEWFVEGMAYDFSDDPREKLEEPWQRYREKFRKWYDAIGERSIEEAVQELRR